MENWDLLIEKMKLSGISYNSYNEYVDIIIKLKENGVYENQIANTLRIIQELSSLNVKQSTLNYILRNLISLTDDGWTPEKTMKIFSNIATINSRGYFVKGKEIDYFDKIQDLKLKLTEFKQELNMLIRSNSDCSTKYDELVSIEKMITGLIKYGYNQKELGVIKKNIIHIRKNKRPSFQNLNSMLIQLDQMTKKDFNADNIESIFKIIGSLNHKGYDITEFFNFIRRMLTTLEQYHIERSNSNWDNDLAIERFYLNKFKPVKGQVVSVELGRGYPLETHDPHPCLVLNVFEYMAVVIPLTSVKKKPLEEGYKSPSEFEIDVHIDNGEDKTSRLHLDEIRGIDISRIIPNSASTLKEDANNIIEQIFNIYLNNKKDISN